MAAAAMVVAVALRVAKDLGALGAAARVAAAAAWAVAASAVAAMAAAAMVVAAAKAPVGLAIP